MVSSKYNIEDEQSRDVIADQITQVLPALKNTQRQISRRRLLALGLGGGGILALGVNGFAFWKRQQRALKVIQHMSSSVSSVAWSPDGRSFAAGDGLGTVSVWTSDGRQVYSQQKLATFFVSSLAWSPDGQFLVVGGDSASHIWQAQSGKPLALYHVPDRSFAWSPDGKWVASGGDYGLIQIWEPATGRSLNDLQAYTGYDDLHLTINSVAWSPDSTHIATVGSHAGDVIALWNVTTGEAMALPFSELIKDPIISCMNAIGWSPDGVHIAAGYNDGRRMGRVALWSRQAQTKTWVYIGSAPAHSQTVHGIAWSPDSNRFASVGEDNKIHMWDISYGLQIDVSTSDGEGSTRPSALQTLSWSPDGKSLLAGDTLGQILLWNVG